MVKLDKIYTKGGDSGETSLGNGDRIAKDSQLIRAIGSIDELNASLGVARIYLENNEDTIITRIQNDLFDLGADISVPYKMPAKNKKLRISSTQITRLESEIDLMNSTLSALKSFILPGGTLSAAKVHMARTICRRSETEIIKLSKTLPINPLICIYINRLSDHLFVTARYINSKKEGDVLWIPGENR